MVSLVRVATRADATAIAHVHVATWRSAYRDVLPADFLTSLSESQYEERWTRTLGDPATRIYVAESASGIVGFASAGPERAGETGFAGELYAIYVLQEAQGHGHGRRLVSAAVGGLRELGLADMIVWVLRDNAPARKFYERLGGKYVRVQQITIGSSLLYEVAYGWRSLNEVVY
ncbi:MAG TPA: GNAT family N-acetyltransferase [Candidatus Dormibacteraeota bacterium]|nr:GNAT family N-acetyltransferase [Candidatus Dormibacteraeota bacterium]